MAWEPLEKVVDMLNLHAQALVTAGIVAPGLLERLEVQLKPLQGIVLLDVEFLELLDDDKDEEIEHDVRYNQDEGQEEKGSQACTALSSIGTVKHDSIPIFSGRDSEKQREALMEVGEVLPLADNIALSNIEEERVA